MIQAAEAGEPDHVTPEVGSLNKILVAQRFHCRRVQASVSISA
jgi:hypothetical protein